jgi:hypothetical protein
MHWVQKIAVVNIVVPVALFPLRSVKPLSMSKNHDAYDIGARFGEPSGFKLLMSAAGVSK